MSPIDWIKVESAVLHRKDISSTGKLLMGLIVGCNSQGLHIPNEDLAELLAVKSDTITTILRILKDKGLIEIKNPQSRYRKIFYSGKKSGLENSTPEYNRVYSGKKSGHKGRTKKKVSARVSFNPTSGEFLGITQADLERWAKAYSGINLKSEIAKAADWLVRKSETRTDYRKYLANWFSRCKPTPEPELPEADTDTIFEKLGYSQETIDKYQIEGLTA